MQFKKRIHKHQFTFYEGPERAFCLKFFCLVLLLYLPAMLLAQHHQFKFDHYTIEDGLSQSTVIAITQDEKGFMYFATEEGVNKFDGHRFSVLGQESMYPGKITINQIAHIYIDGDNMLWVGIAGEGVTKYNIQTQAFTFFRHDASNPNSLSDNLVTTLFEDSKGDLWIGTRDSGLNKFNKTRETFFRFFHDPEKPDSISNNFIRSIFEDASGHLWIGTFGGGLNVFDKEKETFKAYKFDPDNPGSISNNFISCIFEDEQKTLWIGTYGGGLNKFDRLTNQFTSFKRVLGDEHSISSDRINTIITGEDHLLWVGTEEGLNLFDPHNQSFTSFYNEPYDPNSLIDKQVLSLFRDRADTLWIGTGSGVSKLSKHKYKFTQYRHNPTSKNSLLPGSIWSIYKDSKGDLWVGTDNGLNKYQGKVDEFTAFVHDENNTKSLSDNVVRSIFEDNQGNFWIGTYNGLNLFDREKQTFTRYFNDPNNPSSISGNRVRSIVQDRSGNLWAGTLRHGLNKFRYPKMEFQSFLFHPEIDTSIGSNTIHAIYEDRDGILWIGTFGGGLNRYDSETETFIHYKNEPENPFSINSNNVFDIHQDQNGVLWLATAGGGLNCFNTKLNQFKHYTVKEGLANNVIYSILTDQSGNLWLSTNHGLSKFNPITEVFENFSRHNGLLANEFNSGASFKDTNGELFFGGIYGFNSFFPDKIQWNPHLPPVVLTGFKKFNLEYKFMQDVSYVDHINLSYQDVFFSFEFSALEYTDPLTNSYSCQLEGFDKEWVDLGNSFSKSYTNLDPGEYLFKVKATNNDGMGSLEGLSLKLSVTPPFWQTWWFKASALIFACFLIYLVIRLRTYNIRKQNTILGEINEKLKQSEQRLITFLHTASEGFVETDQNELVIDVNPEMCSIMGRQRTELIGRSFFDFFDEGNAIILREQLTKRRKGEKSAYKIRLLRSDQVSISCIVNAAPLFGKDKDVKGSFALITDITEYDKQNEALRQAQKMETIGTLAGGLAHDFNNVLGGIVGTLSVLKMKMNKPEKMPREQFNEYVKTMEKCCQRASTMVKQLLTLSRKQKLSFAPVDLNNILKHAIQICKNSFDKSITLVGSPYPTAATVYADPTSIEQVLLNLAVNASHSMTIMKKDNEKVGGTLTISIERTKVDQIFYRTHPEAEERDYWVLAVRDTGVGIETKTLSKIFDPFFTTKEKGRGTGLGLAMAYSIIKQHHGFVDVYSEVNMGTLFNVFLPLLPGDADDPNEEIELEEMPSGTGQILIVDDEEMMRLTAKEILTECGFDVLLAENGQEGVDQFRQYHQTIKVVLLDWKMPVKAGEEAFLEMKTIQEDVRAILTSGYRKDAGIEEILKLGFKEFIQKPYTYRTLVKAVQKVISAEES